MYLMLSGLKEYGSDAFSGEIVSTMRIGGCIAQCSDVGIILDEHVKVTHFFSIGGTSNRLKVN